MRVLSMLGTAAAIMIATSSLPAAQGRQVPGTSLKVDVVLARYQGEKKTSSLPFTIWLNVPQLVPRPNTTPPFESPQASGSVRMGIDVPVGRRTTTTNRPDNAGGTQSGTNTNTEYRNVGTSIDCYASPLDDGRFWISLRLNDSSIYAESGPGRLASAADPPAFRTFSIDNRLPMRDGQTLEFGTGTDKISGETVRVDVTLNVLK